MGLLQPLERVAQTPRDHRQLAPDERLQLGGLALGLALGDRA